jgi:hypothetical protein
MNRMKMPPKQMNGQLPPRQANASSILPVISSQVEGPSWMTLSST